MIKINVDGAFVEGDCAGYGVVIRDDKGDVLLSAWGMVHYAASTEEVELIACREGVKLAAEWVPRLAILESDCLVAINFLRRPSDQRSQSVFTIKETVLASEKLPSVVFSHVKREQNRVAHELAQIARRLSHCAVWRNRAPVCVEQLVAHDCNFPVQ
nr:unnamed protein product [Digitaria exilis]